MKAEDFAALRKAFPAKSVGKLPKGNVKLDFVGHAAVTDRLLTVDPAWTWEPLATDERGLPAYDNGGGLWIKLTVCGVTRLGYGDGPDPKQRIGDAIRNSAMRFGVALDLWSAQELEGVDPNGGDPTARPRTAEAFDAKHGDPGQPAHRASQDSPLPDPWADAPVAKIPKSDAKWIKAWVARVGEAITQPELEALWVEAAAKATAKEITDEDGVDMRITWTAARDELAEAIAKRESDAETSGHLTPEEAAAV